MHMSVASCRRSSTFASLLESSSWRRWKIDGKELVRICAKTPTNKFACVWISVPWFTEEYLWLRLDPGFPQYLARTIDYNPYFWSHNAQDMCFQPELASSSWLCPKAAYRSGWFSFPSCFTCWASRQTAATATAASHLSSRLRPLVIFDPISRNPLVLAYGQWYPLNMPTSQCM